MNPMIISILILAIIFHVGWGNYLYPLKEGIVEYKGRYYLYKWHLFLGFIPVKLWLRCNRQASGNLEYFLCFEFSFEKAESFYVLDVAKMYLTKSRRKGIKIEQSEMKEVYNTYSKELSDSDYEEFQEWLELRDKNKKDELLNLSSKFDKTPTTISGDSFRHCTSLSSFNPFDTIKNNQI